MIRKKLINYTNRITSSLFYFQRVENFVLNIFRKFVHWKRCLKTKDNKVILIYKKPAIESVVIIVENIIKTKIALE